MPPTSEDQLSISCVLEYMYKVGVMMSCECGVVTTLLVYYSCIIVVVTAEEWCKVSKPYVLLALHHAVDSMLRESMWK